MSYVLDALRRAEADRHRGEVPGLHAPGPAPLGTAAAPAARSRLPWLLGALAVLAAVAAGLWWGARGGSPAPGLTAPPQAAVPRADAGPAAGEVATAEGPGPAAAPAPLPEAMDTATGPGDDPGQPARPANPGEAAPANPVPPPVALPEPVRRPPAPAVADGPLPAPPPMQFGGAFDSPDPKARMLIINGQVWREGDEPVPGWVLERISLHAAQFRVQGRVVALPYDGGPPRRP